MQSNFLSTKQFPALHYRTAGEGNALLLLHGFPEDGGLWEGVGHQLAQDFKVIIPDIPGSGKSELGAEEITLSIIAQSVQAILAAEKIKEIVFAGHSMGGYTALAFAAMFPNYLKGLSLVHSTALADSEEKKDIRRKTIKIIEKGGKKPFVHQMIPSLFSEDYKQKNPAQLAKQIERGLALKDQSMIAYYQAIIARPENTELVKNASYPIQYILGEEDNLLPLDLMMQQTHLSNVTFVAVYPQCGHMSMLEQPEKLYEDLKMFAEYCYRNEAF